MKVDTLSIIPKN